jgi:hypothetical protein
VTHRATDAVAWETCHLIDVWPEEKVAVINRANERRDKELTGKGRTLLDRAELTPGDLLHHLDLSSPGGDPATEF